MRQAGNRLRLIDYGCENGSVSKRTFPGKTPARRIAAERWATFEKDITELKNINENIELLRKRILEYRNIYYDKSHPAIQHDINSIEIAIGLSEIYLNYRNLTENELLWFNGKRFVSETFQNEWKDITDNYLIISEFVKNKKYNRTKKTDSKRIENNI